MQTTYFGGIDMARKNRKFSGTSMARYSAKVGKVMKAVSGDEARAMNMTDNAVYHFAIGQGGYHVLRANVSRILDEKKIPKPARVPFYAMTQYVYRLITKDGMSPEDVLKNKDTILSKYFNKDAKFYKVADDILTNMLSTKGRTGGTAPATAGGTV